MTETTVSMPLYEYELLVNYRNLAQNKEQFCVVEHPLEYKVYTITRDKFIDEIRESMTALNDQIMRERAEACDLEIDLHSLKLQRDRFEKSIWYKLYKFFNR